MPREGMGSGTEGVVDCHGQGWAVTREREGRGTDLVVVCHGQGWAVTRDREGSGTDGGRRGSGRLARRHPSSPRLESHQECLSRTRGRAS